MKKTLIFNWKAYITDKSKAARLISISRLFTRLKDIDCILALPYPWLYLNKDKKLRLASQDVSAFPSGAHTGEAPAMILKSVNVKYAIVGHSERRQGLKETDEIVNQKIKLALASGIIPILCVGETKEERAKNQTEAVIKKELSRDLNGISDNDLSQMIITYEPIWAIYPGEPDVPEDSVKAINLIKKFVSDGYNVNVKVIYGGSVKSNNILDFIKFEQIDGVLIGSASASDIELNKIYQLLKK